MTPVRMYRQALIASALVLLPVVVSAQGTLADYQRAMGLRVKYEGATLNVADTGPSSGRTGGR